jgi:hypothetical protein
MVEKEALAEKVFALLKGNGFQIKIYDVDGNETTDPTEGRRFFVASPNIMVTIDEEGNSIEFSKGADSEGLEGIQKNIRKLADEFLMNSNIKVFGKAIQPRDYSYQAKNNSAPVMESITGLTKFELQILKEVGYSTYIAARALYDSFRGTPKDQFIDALKDLLKQGFLILSPGSMLSISDHGLTEMKSIRESTGLTKLENTILKELSYSAQSKASALKAMLPNVSSEQITSSLQRLHRGGYLDVDQNSFISVSKKGLQAMSTLAESFSKMFGSTRVSQQTLENVRILVRHKQPVDENVRGSRSRAISAIFLECNDERFRFPHNNLAGARAMAQHMAHGGTMSDKVGSYISESTGNLLKLQSFNRYVTTNKLINEDSSGIVETVKENIETIRTELKKLTGVKTYETVKARLETFEREQLAEDDTSALKDLFTIRRFDEKFEEVLPIVKQLVQEKDTYHKRIEEAAGNTVVLRREVINTTPMFEFASEHARLGFKLNELALRIVENDELAGFVNKIGTKLCKEGIVNDFEKAVLTQILENAQVEISTIARKEFKEASDLEAFFESFDNNFI